MRNDVLVSEEKWRTIRSSIAAFSRYSVVILDAATCGSFPGFSRAITLACLHVLGMHCSVTTLEKNVDSHVLVRRPRCYRNSGWILS